MTEDNGATAGSTRRTTQQLPPDISAFHTMNRSGYIRWAERRLGSRADAEEAVDEAFEQLARDWERVLTSENPSAYAWQVLKHRVIDYARARKRRTSLVDAVAFETAVVKNSSTPIEELEGSIGLFQAISALSPRQQDVVVLLHCEDYTTAEAAAQLGITEAGVRSIDRYAKRRLRELLNPPADQEGE